MKRIPLVFLFFFFFLAGTLFAEVPGPGPHATRPTAATNAQSAPSAAEKKLGGLLGKDGTARLAEFRREMNKALRAGGSLAAPIDSLMNGPATGEERREILALLKKVFPNTDVKAAISDFAKRGEAVDLFRDPKVSDALPKNAFSMPGGFRPIIFKNGTNETIRIKSWRNRGGPNDDGWTENRFPDLQGKGPSILTERNIPMGAFEIELKPGEQLGWEVRRGNRDVGGAVVDKNNQPLAGYEGVFENIPGTEHQGMVFKKK